MARISRIRRAFGLVYSPIALRGQRASSMVEFLVLVMIVALGLTAGVMSFGNTVGDAACKPIQLVSKIQPGMPIEYQPDPSQLSPTFWDEDLQCCVVDSGGWSGWECVN